MEITQNWHVEEYTIKNKYSIIKDGESIVDLWSSPATKCFYEGKYKKVYDLMYVHIGLSIYDADVYIKCQIAIDDMLTKFNRRFYRSNKFTKVYQHHQEGYSEIDCYIYCGSIQRDDNCNTWIKRLLEFIKDKIERS